MLLMGFQMHDWLNVHIEAELCPYWRKGLLITVEISTYGIPADTSTKLTAEVRLVEALCHFRSLTL